MPTYEVKCKKCEKKFDVRCPYSELKEQKCECGGETQRLYGHVFSNYINQYSNKTHRSNTWKS